MVWTSSDLTSIQYWFYCYRKWKGSHHHLSVCKQNAWNCFLSANHIKITKISTECNLKQEPVQVYLETGNSIIIMLKSFSFCLFISFLRTFYLLLFLLYIQLNKMKTMFKFGVFVHLYVQPDVGEMKETIKDTKYIDCLALHYFTLLYFTVLWTVNESVHFKGRKEV